jgi:hypothetical protein
MSGIVPLVERLAIVATIDPDAYGTGDQTSDVIDMRNFRQIMVAALGGTLGTAATLDCKVYGDTASNGSFATQITGKEITQLTETGTDSDKQGVINVTAEEVAAQGYRYVRVTAALAAATSDYGVVVLGELAHYSDASAFDLSTVDSIVP